MAVANRIPTNNLPPGSQAWARWMEDTVTRQAAQIVALQKALLLNDIVVTYDINSVDTTQLSVGQLVVVL